MKEIHQDKYVDYQVIRATLHHVGRIHNAQFCLTAFPSAHVYKGSLKVLTQLEDALRLAIPVNLTHVVQALVVILTEYLLVTALKTQLGIPINLVLLKDIYHQLLCVNQILVAKMLTVM